MSYFIKLKKGEASEELLKDPKAFVLLSAIALRSRFNNNFNIHNLKKGQCLIGDHQNFGMTVGEYTYARKRLEKYGLASFKGIPNKGTIATLKGNEIFDISGVKEEDKNV
tara:strand:- start:236 stop:565 length:330 start_codon:yes stop_codon:yes gene_type:complete